MSTQRNLRNRDMDVGTQESLLSRNDLIAMIGLMILGTGLVFAFGQAGALDYGSPWWTLYIAVPGLMFVVAGVRTTQRHGHVTIFAGLQFLVGIVALLLSAIFIFDPTWSFTRGWTLFQGEIWDKVWRWGLIVIGAASIVVGMVGKSRGSAVFGGLLATVGLVFVLNISWNLVWPFAIIAAGIAILLFVPRGE